MNQHDVELIRRMTGRDPSAWPETFAARYAEVRKICDRVEGPLPLNIGVLALMVSVAGMLTREQPPPASHVVPENGGAVFYKKPRIEATQLPAEAPTKTTANGVTINIDGREEPGGEPEEPGPRSTPVSAHVSVGPDAIDAKVGGRHGDKTFRQLAQHEPDSLRDIVQDGKWSEQKREAARVALSFVE